MEPVAIHWRDAGLQHTYKLINGNYGALLMGVSNLVTNSQVPHKTSGFNIPMLYYNLCHGIYVKVQLNSKSSIIKQKVNNKTKSSIYDMY